MNLGMPLAVVLIYIGEVGRFFSTSIARVLKAESGAKRQGHVMPTQSMCIHFS